MDELRKQLKALGFKKYPLGAMSRLADENWQIRVLDFQGDKTLYFIQAYLYSPKHTPKAGVQFDAVFHRFDDADEPWLEISLNNATPQQALDNYAWIYKRLACIPDIHNND